MRLTVAAIGRPSRGAESDLAEDYRRRIDALAGTTRVGPATLTLVDDKSGKGRDSEAGKLLAATDAEAIIALDEHGKQMGSVAFSELLGSWRDQGVRETAFLIGGADGHGKAVLDAARLKLSLGAMTWPHLLARVMIFEQLYRATTLLAGHPYHRA